MNKILFLLIIIKSINLYSQEYKSINFGINVEKYIGLKLKLDLKDGFKFSAFECYRDLNKTVLFPKGGNYGFLTEKDSLLNDDFIVVDVLTKETGKENTCFYPTFFKIFNITRNDTFYFKYDCFNDYFFPFLVYNPEQNFGEQDCDLIQREVDDFTNEIQIQTPQFESTGETPIVIYKNIIKGKISYEIGFCARSSEPYIISGLKNTIVLFEDKTKWTKLSKIDTKVSNGVYNYFAFIKVSLQDIQKFQSNKVLKFRLDGIDEDVIESNAIQLKVLANCITKIK